MSGFKDVDFAERQKAAARARQALVEKFRSMPGSDDPRVVEMRAARQAVGAARETRAIERKAAREAQLKSDTLARQAAKAEREAAEAAERKSARDARYAARKARR